MTAWRRTQHFHRQASNTVCPPRRSFVASDARRRGQTCGVDARTTAIFGTTLPTPAMFAGVDNQDGFTLMADS